jgi:antitoxin component YwqK of YwqJK toxin-antitoxin module
MNYPKIAKKLLLLKEVKTYNPYGIEETTHYWSDCKGRVEGEYKSWSKDKSLIIHHWCEKNCLEGEFKSWYDNGKQWTHHWFKKDKSVANFLKYPELKEKYKLKDGYLLGGDGKYYPDEGDIKSIII